MLAKNWKLATIIGVSLLLVGIGSWYFFFRNSNTTSIASATVKAEKGDIKVTVTGNGSLEPRSSRTISSKGAGAISKINVQNGQQVHKGDVLFELETTSLQTDIDSAVLDKRQIEMELGTLRKQRQYLQVIAPISGTITTLPVAVGQDVANNSTVATIQADRLIFKSPFISSQIKYIKVGQKVKVVIGSLFATVNGKVIAVERVGKANLDGSEYYIVTTEVPNSGSLAVGLEAQADISTPAGVQQGVEAGTLESAETISVRTGVAGKISSLSIQQDSHVNKGQRIAVLTSDNLNEQIASQEIKLQQAQLKLARLQTQLADYKIVAPLDGVITLLEVSQESSSSSSSSSSSTTSTGQNYLQVGDEVKSGQAVASIIGGNGMSVTVPVDEVDIAQVKVGQVAKITVDALPEQSFQGKVTEIAAQGTVSNNVANFDVTLALDQVAQLKAGMTANVEILVDSKTDVVLLPIESVNERQGKKYVMMADNANGGANQNASTSRNATDSRSGNVSQDATNNQGATSNRPKNMRTVETGLYNETMIEIKSGVAVGELVVVPSVTKSTTSSNTRIPGTGGNRAGGMGGFGGAH